MRLTDYTGFMVDDILQIKDLYVEYQSDKGIWSKKHVIHAVNGISLDVKKGEILALAGESGCGKSTLARTIMQLEQSKSGDILFENKNVLQYSPNELKKFRRKVQMIFQNPFASLNPKMRIADILKEPLQINTDYSNSQIENIVREKLSLVGLDNSCLDLYPHEFSGGQRQRIAIARALILEPEFIIADEPVSALDVSIQAQIINLIRDLKEKFNLTFLLITHDMSVIKYLADRVAIMYLGEVVEIGTAFSIFNNPKHPYTKALLNAVPNFMKCRTQNVLSGDLPSPENLPTGCKFHTRCPQVMPICREKSPESIGLTGRHCVRCFLYRNRHE